MPRALRWLAWGLSLSLLLVVYAGRRLSDASGYLASQLVKDPERTPPPGDDIVSPADGTVLYVRRFHDGEVPVVIKRRAKIPVAEFLGFEDGAPRRGFIVGIYMNTFGVHVNRSPLAGRVARREWYNGPQLDMSELEKPLLLSALLPGPTSFRKVLGLAPHQIASEADYITQSAREVLVIEGAYRAYVVRIADYYVGKIVTWVPEGGEVERGQRLGLITWGSQTDLVIEDDGTLEPLVEEGDYVLGAATALFGRRPDRDL